MPAVSEAQRRALNAKFGHAWVKRHHFDNAGPLPARKGSLAGKLEKAGAAPQRRRKRHKRG
jgi:hypothetical protein